MHIQRKAGSTIDVPASALSDMAFLLLIFFIVVAAFVPQTGVRMLLHEDTVEEASALAPQETIILQGKNTDTILYKEQERSSSWVQEFLMESAKMQPGISVVLQAEDSFSYGEIVRITSFVNAAGIAKFRLEGLMP